MKTLVSILILFSALIATPSFANAKPSESVTILSTKRYVCYVKIDKKLIGATIEIWDGETLVQTETAEHVKTIIDFFYLKPGNYTIKVKTATEECTFQYENKE